MSFKDFRAAFGPGEVVKPVVTLIVIGVASYAVLGSIILPEWYRALVLLVVGYWFGKAAPPGGRPP